MFYFGVDLGFTGWLTVCDLVVYVFNYCMGLVLVVVTG